MNNANATATVTTGRYTIVTDDAAYEAAQRQARGVYQRALLAGAENLSGSTLVGTAKSYGYWYARSRANLLARLTRAGVAWCERVGAHGLRQLVIGSAA